MYHRGITLLVFLLLAIGMLDLAQAQAVRGFGVKVGLSTANSVRGLSAPYLVEPIHNLNGAVFVELGIISAISALMQAEYAPRGFNQVVQEIVGMPQQSRKVGEARTRLEYLALPLLLRYHLPVRRLSPSIGAGPRLDVLVGKEQSSVTYGNEIMRADITDDARRMIFGYSLSAGIEWPVLRHTIMVEYRHHFALTASFTGLEEDKKQRGIAHDIMMGLKW